MSKLKLILPSLIALGTAALTIFAPALQGYIAAHPAVSAVVAAIGVVIAHISPTPFSKG